MSKNSDIGTLVRKTNCRNDIEYFRSVLIRHRDYYESQQGHAIANAINKSIDQLGSVLDSINHDKAGDIAQAAYQRAITDE